MGKISYAAFLTIALFATTLLAQIKWTSCSPEPDLIVTKIAIAPSNPDVLYLSVYTDCLWRSEDRGATWTKLQKFDGCAGVKSIAIDPEDPKTLYVTSGG